MQTTRRRCTECGKLLIDPMGNPSSTVLLVGDGPGKLETMTGLPVSFRSKMNDPKRGGDILKDELTRVGIMLHSVLVTNMWMHGKDFKEVVEGKKKRMVTVCPQAFHLDQLVRLFEGRTHVLLMGSEVTTALTGKVYEAVLGIPVKVSSFSKVRFWVSPNPALAFMQPIGELRLAFRRFAEDMSKTKTK